ncbi:hypothetical protein [Paenibacillus sp. FJAT-26967]|uniref:hypothetical protein n=1 Tax=Paenibacillus sp. FJAT-26967 TaxID=1729690 RepID=UPI000B300798|nr:hypothetical protein [Paenibacillus sp. FJAT-26967]
MKKWIYVLIGLCLAAGIYAVIRANIDPTLAPDDIKLRTRIVPAAEAPPQTPASESYTALYEVELESADGKALDQGGYTYKVYPGLDNAEIVAAEAAPDVIKNGHKPENYTFGGEDANTLNPAKEMLERITGAATSTEEAKRAGMASGFIYKGADFPAKVRYYIKERDPVKQESRSYVLFSYHEVKWGKDVSWVKAVKLAP